MRIHVSLTEANLAYFNLYDFSRTNKLNDSMEIVFRSAIRTLNAVNKEVLQAH